MIPLPSSYTSPGHFLLLLFLRHNGSFFIRTTGTIFVKSGELWSLAVIKTRRNTRGTLDTWQISYFETNRNELLMRKKYNHVNTTYSSWWRSANELERVSNVTEEIRKSRGQLHSHTTWINSRAIIRVYCGL